MSESPAVLLSALVPVFNEIGTLPALLKMLEECESVGEIVVVDDGSTDGSQEFLFEWETLGAGRRFIGRRKNSGKGAAVRCAAEAASGTYVIVQDADLEYSPGDIDGLCDVIRHGSASAVYGTRLHPGSDSVFPYFGHLWGNRFFTFLTNLASGGCLALTDMATCYKLVHREEFLALGAVENGFGFDPEITLKIAAAGGEILEIPIRYRGRTASEGKKLHFRHGLEYLRCIWQYRV